MSTRAASSLVVACLLAAGVASLGGCASDTAAARDEQVRANLTPELHTLHQRPIDADNRVALTTDENLRMVNQDWGRFWLFDRPSRLTRERIPR
jgi:hypothetical protein